MKRVAGWLRLLLLAGLLAGPRLAAGPADQSAPAAWLAHDGFEALAARPAQQLRVLVPSPSRGASPHRAAAHALPAVQPSSLVRGIAPSDAGSSVGFRSGRPGIGSPRFPTGPPAALPID
jgi:hypothetical protein